MLRQIIAERISGLKKAGVKLPIISEVAIPAEIIKQCYVEPRLVSVPGIPDLGKLLGIPSFAYGEAYGETAGQWYRVTYPKAISGAVPVCVARGRTGAITTKTIDKIATPKVPAPTKVSAPTVAKVSKVGAAKIGVSEIPRTELYWWKCYTCEYPWMTITKTWTRCPQCGSSDTHGPWAGTRAWEDGLKFMYWWGARKGLGDWGILNWARDLIIKCFEWLGLAMSRMLYTLWGGVQNQIDYVRDKINSEIQRQVDMINAAFSTQMDRVDERIEQLRANVNSALSTQTDRINDRLSGLVDNINLANSTQMDRVIDRVNLRLNDLYEMWGIPSNMAVTPVHTRNETDSGFDFQSYGKTTIHFIAIGGR